MNAAIPELVNYCPCRWELGGGDESFKMDRIKALKKVIEECHGFKGRSDLALFLVVWTWCRR